MKILSIYRHYWPDTTPYARLLRAILERLASDGHDVSVFTAQPSYNDISHPRQPQTELLNGVHVMRVGLLPEKKQFKLVRLINFMWFLLRAMAHVVLRKPYDVIIANGHPPVLMGVVLRWLKWLTGTPYLYHLQDIHPESAQLGGQLGRGWLANFLLRQDIRTCEAADCIVTLSEDMKQTLLERSNAKIDANKVCVINNFPLDLYRAAEEEPVPAVFLDQDQDCFRVLFAGNMGHFQKLERVIQAARLLADVSEIRFIFMGAGAMRDELQQQAGDLLGRNVFFEAYQPVETAFACMQRSDLGVISLAPGIFKVAYPSKTMTYLAAGLPILGIVEPASNVARDIVANDFGYVADSASPADIADTVRCACKERQRWQDGAREYLQESSAKMFGRQNVMEAWSRLATFTSTDERTREPTRIASRSAA